MKERKVNNVNVIEFDTINSFIKYITTTEVNDTFKNESLHSQFEGSRSLNFAKVNNFEEALNLLKHGYTEKTEEIKNMLIADKKSGDLIQYKNILSVQGFHPVVPLYLNNIPNNMVNRKQLPIRDKVINLTKSICYSFDVRSDTILKESIKCLSIINKLESQGYRINLSVSLVAESRRTKNAILLKVKIKNANERMNVSKMTFPLIHPAFLRKLYLRFIEVYPNVDSGFVGGYGTPREDLLKSTLVDDFVLPSIVRKEVKDIKNINDLHDIVK